MMLKPPTTQTIGFHFPTNLWKPKPKKSQRLPILIVRATSVRSLNRKPLQKGRNLSIEAIQTIQALKRANNKDDKSLDQVFRSKFHRLLKFDMIAVLRELLRQNHCLLALKVFEDIREENWYKPQVWLYNEMIKGMASEGLTEEIKLLVMHLRADEISNGGGGDLLEYNQLLTILISFKLSGLAMECYDLMKAIGCEPDRSTFKILVNGLESIGESEVSVIVRQDAFEYYGDSLDFSEEEEIAAS